MRIIKTVLLCAITGSLLSLIGCGGNSPDSTALTSIESPGAEKKEEQIKTYYVNEDVTELIQMKTTVHYDKETDKYLAALNALKKSPKEGLYSLCPNTTFLSAQLESRQLTIDLHLPEVDRLGTSGEGLLLEALSKALFQFNEVDTFEVLVDGGEVDSLMGHYDLSSPFVRQE
ncbi:GerMN domain-containing protein [Paenibacillus sp. FSL L8-0436]|uniref:GerMN domain-containing protein n=1 Tax=Paenibacillus sp. FSL L8-0436 TaxID=2954686 RepID=UPI00315989DA